MFTPLKNIWLYPTEQKILCEAGFALPFQNQTTQSLQDKADQLFRDVKMQVDRSCVCWLSYKTGIGSTARRFALGEDLLTVKKDIEERKDDPVGDFLNTVTTSLTMLAVTTFSKRGPTTGNHLHYRNRY